MKKSCNIISSRLKFSRLKEVEEVPVDYYIHVFSGVDSSNESIKFNDFIDIVANEVLDRFTTEDWVMDYIENYQK